jgi:hypothetical protein
MNPISFSSQEVIYAKDQLEYFPLPAEKWKDGTVVTKWSFTWREKLKILFSNGIYLSVLTFNKPLQPLRMSLTRPEETKGY